MVKWKTRTERRDGTYWLSSPPAMAELLSASQGEGSIKHRVVHGVANDTVGLWVETLRKAIFVI